MDGFKKIGRGLLTFICIMPLVFVVVLPTRNVLWVNSDTAGEVGEIVACVCYFALWLYRGIKGRFVPKRALLVPLIAIVVAGRYMEDFNREVSQMRDAIMTRCHKELQEAAARDAANALPREVEEAYCTCGSDRILNENSHFHLARLVAAHQALPGIEKVWEECGTHVTQSE